MIRDRVLIITNDGYVFEMDADKCLGNSEHLIISGNPVKNRWSNYEIQPNSIRKTITVFNETSDYIVTIFSRQSVYGILPNVMFDLKNNLQFYGWPFDFPNVFAFISSDEPGHFRALTIDYAVKRFEYDANGVNEIGDPLFICENGDSFNVNYEQNSNCKNRLLPEVRVGFVYKNRFYLFLTNSVLMFTANATDIVPYTLLPYKLFIKCRMEYSAKEPKKCK